MEATAPLIHRNLRTLLVLGRVSNIPTVWSNCLAGWLLGGGGRWSELLLLCLGASCIYVGGMYLNDAFDEDFDRMHRAERPIASGLITAGEVWGYAIGWLALGAALLVVFGKTTAVLTLLLLGCVVVYDAVHKAITLSPVLMAACRMLLFLIAASVGKRGITGLALWSSLALGCYVVGLSYVAKSESTRGPLRYWPCYFLGVPLLLALIVNRGPFFVYALLASSIFAIWVMRNLRFTFWAGERNISRTVSGLLAGIALVDFLAVGGPASGVGVSLVLLMFFSASLVFQRFIPAT